MSRTTNTDTLPHVDSRYELGLVAAQRVRDMNGGEKPIVEVGRDKPTVTALREIATGELDIEKLRHELVQSYKDIPTVEEAESDLESQSAAPELREIDAELSEFVKMDAPMTETELTDELDAATPDSGEAEAE